MSFTAGATGSCPHCKVHVRFESVVLEAAGHRFSLGQQPIYISRTMAGQLRLLAAACPSCARPIITADRQWLDDETVEPLGSLLWPDGGARPVPPEVREQAPQVAADFQEAAVVFSKSRKASAALSRRCLQSVLREKGGTKSRELAGQIKEVLSHLPSELALNLDAIRQIGNFAAHPIKSQRTGEIVQVEEGEAEWLLDVLEELFDYYYVGPARAAARRQQLNDKLAEIGKSPLQVPAPTDRSTPG